MATFRTKTKENNSHVTTQLREYTDQMRVVISQDKIYIKSGNMIKKAGKN